MKIRKNWIKQFGTFLLAGIVAFSAAGCGGDNGTASDSAAENTSASGEKAMGRYVESAVDLTGQISNVSSLVMMEDGTLEILDNKEGLLVSKDEGKTWKNITPNWLEDYLGGNMINYIFAMSLTTEGKIVILYSPCEEETEEKIFHPKGVIYDQDGEGTDLPLELNKNGNFVNRLFAPQSGKIIYGADLDGGLYGIDTEKGTVNLLYTNADRIGYVAEAGNHILLFSEDKLVLFNPETGDDTGEDPVLFDFISGELTSNAYNYVGSYEFFAFQNEEDAEAIYIAARTGLYRHVIGGNAMEQMIDGALTNFSNPSANLVNAISLPGGDFLVLFTDGNLIRYHYDKTVPTVPEKTITAYSLKQNDVLQQAISLYQKQNPNVYVKYEVGMDGSGSITEEDAAKKLNTEIMAGEGPDVLITDGLPIDSYMEKGVLMDISPYLKKTEDGFLENIQKLYQRDQAIYAIPTQFVIPVIEGKQEDISQIRDLASLAAAAEKLREKYPEGSILGLYTPENLMELLYLTSFPALFTNDQKLDEDRLREFLILAERIYEAETAGISAEELREYEETVYGSNIDFSGKNTLSYYNLDMTNQLFTLMQGKSKIALGYISQIDFGYDLMMSIEDGMGNYQSNILNGMSSQVYIPNSIIAVNAATQNLEEASELFMTMLSYENLKIDHSTGFPVNLKALQKRTASINGKGGEVYGSIGIASSEDMNDNTSITLDIRGLKTEEEQKLRDMAAGLVTPNIVSDRLAGVIKEQTISLINQNQSLEETIKQIKQKAEIYLAE